MNEMIYDFKTHSLSYRNPDIDVSHFSLAIDTLELVFEIQTGKLLGVQGFFPLIKANVCNVDFPKCKLGEYSCAVKPHVRSDGNRQSGTRKPLSASLLA